jgi:sulfatase maturation enzyme AslB (radical SAM superfamily)
LKTSSILSAWRKILRGERPSLSIEITRECPLRCPGCYAYDEAHLSGGATLRTLNDRKGQELINGVLQILDRYRPLHLSIVGGDPLVRYRELETMIPLILDRGVHVQVVTSAFRPLSPGWPELPRLNVVVSIDGLQPEHDARRAPATYSRILKNIAGQKITIHCTITGQMCSGGIICGSSAEDQVVLTSHGIAERIDRYGLADYGNKPKKKKARSEDRAWF